MVKDSHETILWVTEAVGGCLWEVATMATNDMSVYQTRMSFYRACNTRSSFGVGRRVVPWSGHLHTVMKEGFAYEGGDGHLPKPVGDQ